jgi:plastocyanin
VGLLSLCGGAPLALRAQQTVTTQVEIVKYNGEKTAAGRGHGDVVVWLRPLDAVTKPVEPAPRRAKLVQSHKTFEPHLLVVEVGSVVDFPNRDPFFHNVFSLFEGKRFDLGLYEAGATNSVRFDRVGVSFLFCNIHPEMSAVVVAVDTSFYGVTNREGRVAIAGVPDGRYEVHYWLERALPEVLKQLTKTVVVSSAAQAIPAIEIAENPNFTATHKNKYGQDYVPAPNAGYPYP